MFTTKITALAKLDCAEKFEKLKNSVGKIVGLLKLVKCLIPCLEIVL